MITFTTFPNCENVLLLALCDTLFHAIYWHQKALKTICYCLFLSHLLCSRLSMSFPAFRASSSLRLVPADIFITSFKILAANLGGNRQMNGSLHSCLYEKAAKNLRNQKFNAESNQTKLDQQLEVVVPSLQLTNTT